MEGVVVSWIEGEFCDGIIEDQNDDWWRVSGNQVEHDSIGRRFLIVGEIVSFEAGSNHATRNGKSIRKAVNVRRPFRETQIDWRTHREYAEVFDEYWLLRMYGGRLSLPVLEVPVCPGQVVRCGAKPPAKGNTWRAFDVQVVHDDGATFNWASVPIDGETVAAAPFEPMQPIEEKPSVLLTDKFRGKKLRDIGIRRTS